MARQETERRPVPTMEDAQDRIGTAAWAAFFIWIGIALFAELGWGLGLLGAGVITFGAQLVRKWLGFSMEAFWLFVGLLFSLGGVWELLDTGTSVAPVLLIAIGVGLLASKFWPRRARPEG